jgi:hypothetical protein
MDAGSSANSLDPFLYIEHRGKMHIFKETSLKFKDMLKKHPTF